MRSSELRYLGRRFVGNVLDGLALGLGLVAAFAVVILVAR